MTITEIAELVGGAVSGDALTAIRDAASIDEAREGDITYLAAKRFLSEAAATRASAVITTKELAKGLSGLNLIVVEEPALAFAKVVDKLRPLVHPGPGIAPSAVVSKKARIGEGVSIGAVAVIEDGARIGDNSIIYPGVYVGRDVAIGKDSVIYPNVTLREGTMVGSQVTIHSNTAIGSDGFGYLPNASGDGLVKVPQRGIVRIESDCEIGSSVTIDRAMVGETVIGRGTKIDNLVQIAHNVKLGQSVIVVAQAGIAGSTVIGNGVQIGGQAGLVGHLKIGDGAKIGANSGIAQDIPPGEVYSGSPGMPHGTWLRAMNLQKKLPEIKKEVNEIKKRLGEVERATAGTSDEGDADD